MHAGTSVARAEPRHDAKKAVPPACGEGMVLVDGNYCPDVEQVCKRYADPPGRYQYFRCLEYAPSRCLSKKRSHLHFCIDRYEYSAESDSLPANFKSFSDAKNVCASEGKRVCLESEWQLACEGEEMRPYPYGWTRDADACHADVAALMKPDGHLKDQRAPSGSHPHCASPFGVQDMTGNLEEFVALDAHPSLPAMKGAYWQPGRNHCRAKQTAHDAYYNGVETGFRCCADPTN